MNPSRPLQTSRGLYDGLKFALLAAMFLAGAYLYSLPSESPQSKKPPAEPLLTSPPDGAKFNTPLVPFTGTGEPGALLQLVIDGYGVQSDTVGEDGQWFMQYELYTEGEKVAYVRTLRSDGAFGAESNRVKFRVDTRDDVRLDGTEDLTPRGEGRVRDETGTMAPNAGN